MARVEAVEFVAEVRRQRTVKQRCPKVVLRQIHMIRVGLVNRPPLASGSARLTLTAISALRRRPDVLAVGQDEILRALRGAAGGKRQGGGNREEAHYRLPFGMGSLLLLLKISALVFLSRY